MLSLIPDLHWHAIIAGVLATLLFGFVAFFLTPAIKVGFQLRRVIKALSRTERTEDLGPAFEPNHVLRHLWLEFRDTLHEEKAPNSTTGLAEVVAVRATVPAEMFFTEETIVDTPLRTEFFKHLPGIFTGIGIIGTFAGLLQGLSKFRVAEDPAAARQGLEVLLGAVSQAFLVSASAIALAMIVTFIEKLTLVRLYKKVQLLTQSLDERFRSGVGEEYLARLVGATEESASQSRILKDALVGDLKNILTEISDKQIAAISASNNKLGSDISESVAGQLRGPLERLASITEGVRGDQASAVQQLMADLLARFTDRLEGLLGSQVSGIQQMQQQAIASLQEAVNQLRHMSATVEGAGQRASQALMEKLEHSLDKLDQRQLVMNEEMRKFVQEIRTVVGQTNADNQQQLRSLLSDLARQTGALVGDLSQKSQSAVAAIGGQVEGLSAQVAEAVSQMAVVVTKMESATSDSIARMNSGAETLALAADDFARAGSGVSTVMAKAESIATQLTQSADSLAIASNTVEILLKDYKSVRDSLGQMLSVLQSTVEAARREASITADVLHRLELSAGKLASAQQAADEYLQQINNVLATSHDSFAQQITRTLNVGNREFLNGVSGATKMLKESIIELEEALSGILDKS